MTTDGSDDRPDDRATDAAPPSEDELWVARTLADLPGASLPPELGRRLDARLAALVAERESADASGVAVTVRGPQAGEVSRSSRRRRWPQLALAAAAVLVGGYAVGTGVLGSLLGPSASESSSAGGGAESSDDSRKNAGSDGPAAASEPRRLFTSTVALRSDHLRADVRRVLAAGDETRQGDPADQERAAECPPPAVKAAATAWLVELDGGPAVLVTTPRGDGRVRATVYSCDTAPLATTTVRAP